MRILGVDPGTSKAGWGVINGMNSGLELVSYGCINVSSCSSFPKRIKKIAGEISKIISLHNPEVLSMEEPFLAKNPKAALKIGQVAGAIMLSAMNRKLKVKSYSVLEIKQAVVGYGRANKHQVQEMVKILLNLDTVPEPEDAADALAAAVCHQHSKAGFRVKR